MKGQLLYALNKGKIPNYVTKFPYFVNLNSIMKSICQFVTGLCLKMKCVQIHILMDENRGGTFYWLIYKVQLPNLIKHFETNLGKIYYNTFILKI